MKTIRSGIIVSLIGLFVSAPAWIGEAAQLATRTLSPLQQPEHFQGIAETEGRIQAIDRGQGSLFLVDSSDKEWQIQVTQDTQITTKENASLGLNDLKKNDVVHIYFNTTDMSARQVDVVKKTWLAS